MKEVTKYMDELGLTTEHMKDMDAFRRSTIDTHQEFKKPEKQQTTNRLTEEGHQTEYEEILGLERQKTEKH